MPEEPKTTEQPQIPTLPSPDAPEKTDVENNVQQIAANVSGQTTEQLTTTQENTKLTPEYLADVAHLEVKVNNNLQPVLDAINAEMGLNMEGRPEGYHVTIIGPSEATVLKTLTDEQLTALNQLNEEIKTGMTMKVTGIGFVDGSKDPVSEKDKDKKTCYIALDPVAINKFRTSIGLVPRYPHITLGFEKGDIHMKVTGNKDAKGKDILEFYPKTANQDYEKFLPLIPPLEMSPMSGPIKQRKKK